MFGYDGLMIASPSPTPPAGAPGAGSGAGRVDGLPEDAAGILAAAEANLAASRRLGAQRLALAYAWAGAHEKPATEPLRGSRRAGGLRRLAYRELGAVGIPMAEDAPAELGISLAISSSAARHLMADAIDLVHRLPRTWTAVQAGALEAWVGRKIARLTRDLSEQAAGWVDAELAGPLGSLPTGRLLSLAEAKGVAADREAADAKAAAQRRGHTLHLGRATEHGTRTLFARCEAADALRFYTLADQLARALQTQTSNPDADTETLDQLRARAIGILANPALALSLLAHAPDPEPTGKVPEAGADAESGPAEDPGPDPLPDPGTDPLPADLSDPGLQALLAPAARAARARTTLYVHLTPAMLATGERPRTPGEADLLTGALAAGALGTHPAGGELVARAEEIGALTKDMLTRLLGHEHITVKPVINLADHLTSDRCEVPTAISERLHLAKPHDVFPYAESLSRRQDQDHTVPFDPARAASGDRQTHLGNLANLTRTHRRIKTHAPGWRTWQLDDHTPLWRTPHGRYRLVDQTGTHNVDTTERPPPTTTSPLAQRLAQLTAAVA
jgi:hypothetical protein